MARDLITELFDRFGKEENYGYKKYEIGVYLPNVIGFNEESKKYVSKIADPYGYLDPDTRERSYSFLNKFDQEKFKIILEDIRVVETDLADSNKAVLFTGTYDNTEGRKYQYIDQNIAAKNGSFYINDSLYIGSTQDAITLNEDGVPIVDETKADYIFKQPTESDPYGVIIKNDLKVDANIYNTGNMILESDLEVKHSATFGSADSEDDLFKVISSAKFDKYVNIADKYEFKNSEDGAIFHEKVLLDKNLTVDGDTILNKNLNVKKNIEAVYDTASNSYRIIANNDDNVFIVNFANNKFTGNLSIDKDTVIGKEGLSTLLTINSATSIKNTLSVTGAVTLKDSIQVDKNANIDGTLSVTGATTLKNTLGVTGATTLNDTLNVVKKVTLNDSIQIDKNANIDGTLSVTGVTTLKSALGVTGNTTIGGTLGVTGATTLSNTLGVTGATTLNDTLKVVKKATFNDNIQVDKNANISGTLNVTGATTLNDILKVVKQATFNDNIQVDKNANISGTLGVTGATTLNNSLGVTGATTLSNTLEVIGATILKDTLSVAKLATFNNGITVKGTANIEGISISGDATLDHLTVLNTSTFNGAITAKEAVTLNKTLNVDGDTIIGKTGTTTSLTVNSVTTLNDTLKVVKKATFNDNIQVDKNANISGTLSVTGVTTLKDNLTVGTDSSTKTVTVHGSLISDNGTFKNLTVTNPNADGTNSATATIYNLLSYNSTFSGTKTTINSTQLSISSSIVDIDPYINMSSNLITIKKPISIINNSSISSNGALSLDGNVSLFKSTNNYLFRLSSNGLYSDFSTNTFGGNIIPKTDVAHNLGSTTNRWNNIYVNTINGSTFTGNAASATKLLNARTITIKGVQLASPTKTSNSVSTTFNGTSNIEFDISGLGYDASKIISGIIDIERLPKGALDRLLIVDNKNARLALTKDDVQYGDTVQEDDTKLMYYVCDESKLGTSKAENAFREYTVGHATAVPWSGVENKPDWILNPRYLTINREGESNSVINYTATNNSIQSQTLNIKKLDIILQGGLHSTKSTTTYNTGTSKSVTITPASIGAAPEKGSTDIATLASTITLGAGGSASIIQNSDTYWQKFAILDNSTSGDGVFEFSQSSDSGASYKSLMRIDDNGTVRATKFIGAIEGNVTGKADTAGVADKLTTSSVGSNTKFMYLNNGVATASTGTVASATQLMYLNNGTFTASTGNVSNDGISLMGLVNGVLTKSAKTVASATQLMYLNSGTLTASTANVSNDGISLMGLVNGVLTKSTQTVANATKLMYLNAGTLTASTATVASATRLMYLNSGSFAASSANVSNDGISLMGLVNGSLTKSTQSIGANNKIMYLSSGTLTASTANIGSTDTPVYLSNGTITSTGKNFSDYFKRSGSVVSNPNTSSFSISNTVDGYLLFSNTGNTAGVARGIGGVNGINDGWAVRGYQTGDNKGALEISVGDDGDEGIYVRQYTSTSYKLPFMNNVGASGTTCRETILMEPSTGDAKFYRKVYANGTNGGFVGNLSGTATNAQYLTTPYTAGYNTDEFGNIHPKSSVTDSNCWVWYNNAGTDKTKYYWNSGNIEFTGKITGNGGLKTTTAEVTGNTKTSTATIGDHVTLQYNSSTESLDFVFS